MGMLAEGQLEENNRQTETPLSLSFSAVISEEVITQTGYGGLVKLDFPHLFLLWGRMSPESENAQKYGRREA